MRYARRVVIDCWRTLAHLQGIDGISYVRLGFGGTAQVHAMASSGGQRD